MHDLVSPYMLAAWPLAVVALILLDRRHGNMPLFLCYAYIAGLAVIHWPGAFAHALPWNPFMSSDNTILGFEYTTLGMACFVLGTAITPRSWAEPTVVLYQVSKTPRSSTVTTSQRWVRTLMAIGLVFWIAENTAINGLPSITSIISAGKQLLIVAICIGCWLAWKSGSWVKLYSWLTLALAFPAYTIIGAGFLSYGVQYLMTVLIFVGTFYRPRWLLICCAVLGIYGGTSFFVTYLEQRRELREVIWTGNSIDARIAAFTNLLSRVAPFDYENPTHLEQLDARLNQNELVGSAITYVPAFKDFAYGQTISLAVVALIPRALWPDKPLVAGSMGMVTPYTGLVFNEYTSVGMGQVMEFYVNFGTTGIVIGFLLLGMLFRIVDFRIAASLLTENWPRTTFWLLIGCSAIQPIGQLLEVTTSVAAAAILATLLTSSVGKRFGAPATTTRRLAP